MNGPQHKLVALSTLPVHMQRAATAAVAAYSNAYAPYSHFGVGAALLHDDGAITAGCNYENCTYQACCAERCAIVKANVEGRRTAQAVAVYGRQLTASNDANDGNGLCYPCGLCRQLLYEVAQLSENTSTFAVICVSKDAQQALVVPLSALLPSAFGPSDVGVTLTTYKHIK